MTSTFQKTVWRWGSLVVGGVLLGSLACGRASTTPATPEPEQPTVQAPVGQTIWLKACATKHYVSADACLGATVPLAASQDTVRDWERFEVIDAGEGLIGLRASGSGKYVAVDASLGARVVANQASLGDGARFEWVALGEGSVGLKVPGGGPFVSADSTQLLYANAPATGCSETFTWGVADSSGGGSAPDGWVQVWSDEFDRACINPSNWTFNTDIHVNNEQQQYTNSSRNTRVSDGTLKLTAVEEQAGRYAYTSGRLESGGKREFTHGRFEARIKLPVGEGLWPAFWVLGNDVDTVSWPQCGELDIMENVGYRDWTSGALHGPGYSGNTPINSRFTLASAVSEWHTYRADVSAEDIRWYVDDVLVKTTTKAEVNQYGKYVYDHPFFIILNLAVGGVYPYGQNGASSPHYGVPQATADLIHQTPQTMEVDWVRVYQRP